MKLEQLNEDLSSLNIDREACADYLDFTPGVTAAEAKLLVQRGWWHVLPIAKTNSAVLALRVLPELPFETWPVVKIFGYNRAITFAPNLTSLPAFSLFHSVYKDNELIQDTLEEWELILAIADSLPDAFDKAKSLNTYRLSFEESFVPNLNAEDRYRIFWQLAYPESDCLLLMQTIDQMQKDEKYLPKAYLSKNPVLANRWAHLLGIRAYERFATEWENKNLAFYLMNSWQAMPGFDAEAMVMKFWPSETSDSDIQDFQTAEALMSLENPDETNKIWKDIARSLIKQGRNNYIGNAHLLAAEQSLGKSKELFWKLAIGAAYWSGINSNSANGLAMDLVLSKKDLWHLDAQYVLEKGKSLIN